MPKLFELLDFIRQDFNERCKNEPRFRLRFERVNKLIQAEVKEEGLMHFRIADCQVSEVVRGPCDNPDVRLIADLDTIIGVLSGKLSTTVMVLSKKLKVVASMQDMLLLKRFLDDERDRIASFMKDFIAKT